MMVTAGSAGRLRQDALRLVHFEQTSAGAAAMSMPFCGSSYRYGARAASRSGRDCAVGTTRANFAVGVGDRDQTCGSADRHVAATDANLRPQERVRADEQEFIILIQAHLGDVIRAELLSCRGVRQRCDQPRRRWVASSSLHSLLNFLDRLRRSHDLRFPDDQVRIARPVQAVLLHRRQSTSPNPPASRKYEPKSNSTFSSMIGAMYCANSICAFDLFAPVVPRYPSARVSGVTSKSGRRIVGGAAASPPTTGKAMHDVRSRALSAGCEGHRALAPPKIANIARRRFPSSARASTSVASPRARATTDVTRVGVTRSPGRSPTLSRRAARARAGRFRDLDVHRSRRWRAAVFDAKPARAGGAGPSDDIIRHRRARASLRRARRRPIGRVVWRSRWPDSRESVRRITILFDRVNLCSIQSYVAFRLFRASPSLDEIALLILLRVFIASLVLARTRLR